MTSLLVRLQATKTKNSLRIEKKNNNLHIKIDFSLPSQKLNFNIDELMNRQHQAYNPIILQIIYCNK